MTYASFWQRFAAAWIDIFVLAPALIIQAWLEGESKIFAYFLAAPMALSFCAYAIYGHGRFGKTIGKHIMNIRVVLISGQRAGWRAACLRSSVDACFAAVQVFSIFWALSIISDQQYYGIGWEQRASNITALEPDWLDWVNVALQFWVWSEIVVMLFNAKRRSLHDYIAGTVVISEKGP